MQVSFWFERRISCTLDLTSDIFIVYWSFYLFVFFSPFHKQWHVDNRRKSLELNYSYVKRQVNPASSSSLPCYANKIQLNNWSGKCDCLINADVLTVCLSGTLWYVLTQCQEEKMSITGLAKQWLLLVNQGRVIRPFPKKVESIILNWKRIANEKCSRWLPIFSGLNIPANDLQGQTVKCLEILRKRATIHLRLKLCRPQLPF